MVFIKSTKQGENRNSSLMLHYRTEFYPCLFSRNKPLNIWTDLYKSEHIKCYLIYGGRSSHNTSLRCETLAVRCYECWRFALLQRPIEQMYGRKKYTGTLEYKGNTSVIESCCKLLKALRVHCRNCYITRVCFAAIFF